MVKKVYLAGPIHGKSDYECNHWRRTATETLTYFGHGVLDPMTRDYRGMEDYNAEAIVKGDLADILSCDAVLVNANSPSWGTCMELVYAKQYCKEVVAFATYSLSPRISPWLRIHTTAVYDSVDCAVRGIVTGSMKGIR